MPTSVAAAACTRARRSTPPPVPWPMRRGSPSPGSTPGRWCRGCRAPRPTASSPSAAPALVDGARVRLASARVTGPELHANASGNLDVARSVADLTLGARADLTQLGRRLGRPLAGAASLSASAPGPLAALAARATATVERPLYGALGADHLSARLALDGLGSRAPHGTLHLEAPALRVALAAPADALADLEWRRAGDMDRARVSAHAVGEEGRPL